MFPRVVFSASLFAAQGVNLGVEAVALRSTHEAPADQTTVPVPGPVVTATSTDATPIPVTTPIPVATAVPVPTF